MTWRMGRWEPRLDPTMVVQQDMVAALQWREEDGFENKSEHQPPLPGTERRGGRGESHLQGNLGSWLKCVVPGVTRPLAKVGDMAGGRGMAGAEGDPRCASRDCTVDWED